ncbi:MAG: tetratricopeptide repeat protein [Candidatus Omnitrophota bacterium]
MKVGVCVWVFFFAAGFCFAAAQGDSGAVELFEMGNGYYEKGEYDRAAEAYEGIIARGDESGRVYYNLANAYFKSGRLGKAVINYERARYLMPRDGDLAANLAFARERVIGKVAHQRSLWEWFPLRVYRGSFTANEFMLLSSAGYIGLIIFLIAGLRLRVLARYRTYGIILAAAFILFNSAVAFHKAAETRNAAVVTVPQAAAMFGPFDSATKYFTLHEGMDVVVLKMKDDWYKVKRADGKIGWIKSGDVERVWGTSDLQR